MKIRVYEFITGIESSTQPDAGVPILTNDIVTKGYADALLAAAVGAETQETPSGSINGSNTAFTLAHTPLDAGTFKLYRSGGLLTLGTHYTRAGTAITMIVAPVAGQTLLANYRY